MVLVRPATELDLPAIKAIYDVEVLGDHVLVAVDGEDVVNACSGSFRPRAAYDWWSP